MAYSDSDSKPGVYILQYRSFHIGSDLDLDPNWDSFQMVTVPILGMDVHPKDRCPNCSIFQSRDPSPNLNQWEIAA